MDNGYSVIYGVFLEHEVDDGYGVPVWMDVCLFVSTKEICEKYCKKYNNPHTYKDGDTICVTGKLHVKEIAPIICDEVLDICPEKLTYLQL